MGDKPERVREAKTSWGDCLKVTYGPGDVDSPALPDIPGEYPYTRGIYGGMYRDRFWTMRQFAGFGTPEDSNKHFKYLLEQGQTALSVAFDLPTQLGYDSDHPLARGFVGRVGVAIDTLHDLEQLFEGIPINQVSVNFTINATAPVILAMYVALARKRGLEPRDLAGTLQNDILKEYISRHTYIYPPGPSLRLVADIIDYCRQELPRFNPISITGYHAREAGANVIQEVAFAFAAAITYVDLVLERGIPIDAFAPRLSFHFAATGNLFEEAAKFRAARRLWAKIAREKYGATDPKSWLMRVFSGGSGATLTRQDPLNNIVRSTLQVMAGVLGGVQSIHAMAYDEAYSIPTREAVRTALRTQQILAYESGLPDTVDPLGGSYYGEALTNQIEAAVVKEMEAIEKAGGMAAAIEQGLVQKAIEESAFQLYRDMESGQKVVVGVNRFAEGAQVGNIKVEKLDPGIEPRQIARTRDLLQARDGGAVARALAALEAAAAGNSNLVPFLIEAVTAGCTIGEISAVFEKCFGRHVEQYN